MELSVKARDTLNTLLIQMRDIEILMKDELEICNHHFKQNGMNEWAVPEKIQTMGKLATDYMRLRSALYHTCNALGMNDLEFKEYKARLNLLINSASNVTQNSPG